MSMADTWITDLTHFLENGRLPRELPGPALRLVEYLGKIVAGLPERRPCPGEIEGHISPESNAIYWECLVCGDKGLISNWENTMWDLRAAGEHTRH